MDRYAEIADALRDPATPRPIDEARKAREDRAEIQREQDIRATALQIAVGRLGTQDPELYAFADKFVAYITDGTRTGSGPQ